ncbi:hypothetical protein Misp06_03079 [Microbulbifer sp. NBRC 101763]
MCHQHLTSLGSIAPSGLDLRFGASRLHYGRS